MVQAVQPTIRGVGTAITTSGGGPNVGIYVDGFFQANTCLSDFDLLTVRNIQVLKGPQGTLFGRNTTGGAIIVTTAEPSSETSGQGKVSYGRFNSVKAQAYATFGIPARRDRSAHLEYQALLARMVQQGLRGRS
ncbi:TonB-dependent receptor plug domain-containing protein [Novosphingobium mangrovi (ex Huang et al. 2023)]|uniref:TonB-dependent receptor plug domain-containing protein n=1 Tax=Novosphingobium mangrovi (ex Huang et al. 2023) TaxID=2976432 RepID=A0ABT2I520_9SPHN|nr:TonB-dependent receptor plug domain-containing protein [Novosphingobium mangrovi (ex Huang et al. 2023)]MCT2399914.1 TonB-dependent receptor plug domain-containing protein [Novosphingobium mangrovi (ex Huang et al. 2023)]